jgi:hypothetical protein
LRVELLWWEGCPSTEPALELVRGVMEEEGLDPEAVDMREIETEDDAGSRGFIGSPTIRIGGEEVAPEPGEPAALTCRVYHLRDGRISAVPDREDVRDAIRRARG